MIAILAFAASRLIANAQDHAYDPGAQPDTTYQLTQGETYQLSSRGGVAELKDAGVLGTEASLDCTATGTDGVGHPLNVTDTRDDVRDLHVFAEFVAPASGQFQLACQGVAAVFVDDADSAQPDLAALLVLLSWVVGLIGTVSVLSGAYDRGSATRAGVNASPHK
jgi:hypothetical protein